MLKGDTGAHRRLCRFGLFPALQPDAAGHLGGERRPRLAEVAARGARTDGSLAHAALIRSSPVESVSRAAVQSDRRLCELCRSGRLHADPAADAAAWLRRRSAASAFEQGGRARRQRRGGARAIIGQALAHLLPRDAGHRALSDRSAARLRLFDARAPAGPLPDGRSLRPVGEFSGAVRRRMVQAPRDARCSCSSRSACRFSSWSACPGRSRPSRTFFARPAASSPAPSAIDGLVRINQMGASIHRRVARLDHALASDRHLRPHGRRGDPDRQSQRGAS